MSGAVSASGDLSPNSFVSQFICLPGPVAGAVSASGGFVSQFICPPCVRGCVRLRTICLPIHLSSNSFVSQVLCQGLCPPPGDLSPNSFVSQFICLPSPVSGAVSASGGFVSQFICPPCVRGCVRLRTICLPIHLSPNSFVSQFICLPGPVSGAVSASGGFVSQFICPPCVRGCVRLRGICLPIHLSPTSFVFQFICLPIHLSPRSCVRGCVRLRGICLPIHLSPNSFVSQVLCQGLCPPPGDLSPNSFVRLVSGAVSASGRFVFQFICLPIHLSRNSFVSQVLCRGLCPPPGDLSPNSFVRLVSGAVSASGGFVSQFICLPLHLSPGSCVRGCVRLRGICLPIHLSPNSFVSQVLCQGLCPPPGDLFPNSFVSQVLCQGLCPPFRDLSPIFFFKSCVRGCVRLRGICLPIHLSPNSFVSQFICLPGPVSGAVSASGGFVSQFICPPCVRGCVRLRTICLPIHLSPNSFVSQVLVSQFICLPIHSSPRSCVRGCVRLRGICLPIHLSALCQGLCPPPDDLSSNSFVSQFICLPGPVSGAVSASGGFVSQFICLPIHSSPRSSVKGCVRLQGICFPINLSPRSSVKGCVRLSGIPRFRDLSPNSFVSQVLCQGLCPPRGICLPIPLSPNSFVSQVLCQGL